MLIMPETATCVVRVELDTLILQHITSDGFGRWDASSQDRILLWNCQYMKMCFVLVHGYSTVKQIVMLWIMKNCLFELAFMIFSPFSALYLASLHQDLLQQLPSCTVFDSSPLIVFSVLNSIQNCSCRSCAGSLFKWEQTFWKRRGLEVGHRIVYLLILTSTSSCVSIWTVELF